MNLTRILQNRCMQTLTAAALTFATLQVQAMDCPTSPTQFKNVSIPNPNPPPAAGEFPADLDKILAYVTSNNITTVKQFLDHLPLHLRKHYSFVRETGGLNETSVSNPGLLTWGSDARFMMNLGSKRGAPLYDVVDLAQLKDNGDWEFRALDFRGATPQLSPIGGTGGECRQCHAKGGNVNVAGSLRPILGNYLHWDGFISNSGGAGGEHVMPDEKPILDAIKAHTQNNDRFHSIIISDSYYSQVGTSNHMPDHAYGPGLTIFNTEMSTSVAESVHKRLSRNANYRGLREEILALSYCDNAGALTAQQKNRILDLTESLGGARADYAAYNSWATAYQALGIEPKHEFPLHFKTKNAGSVTDNDINWNTGVSNIREVVDFLILMELAKENVPLNNLLASYQTSYDMTGGCSFNSLKDHLDHKEYALFTLKGNARQKARESYYDIDYVRIHASLDNVKNQLCGMLTSDIGLGTIGTPGNSTNLPPVARANGPYSGSAGVDIAFSSAGSSDPDGSISSYNWDFGDGGSSAAANPVHRYTAAGNYAVTLTVTDNKGASKQATTSSVVTDPNSGAERALQNGVPKSGLSGSASQELKYYIDVPAGATNLVIKTSGGSGDVDLYTRLDAEPTTSVYSCRPYLSNNDETCTTASPSPGRWHVLLKGYSAFSGVTLTASYTVNTNQAPVARTNGPYTGRANSPIQFSSAGSSDPDGTISGFKWTFGDGTDSTSANPSHAYASAGTYSVSLTVTDNRGATHQGLTTATVVANTNQPPSANANGPYTGVAGANIAFSSSGSVDPEGQAVTYLWDFGDGTTSTAQNPAHVYATAGSYVAKLTVTDNLGASSSANANVTVATTAQNGTQLSNGVPVTGLSGAAGQELKYYVHVHGANPKNLKISMSGGTGDADLHVKRGVPPTVNSYDCRPYLSGNAEDCTIASPTHHDSYFVMIRGYSAFSGVTLTATYDEGNATGNNYLMTVQNSSQYGNYLAGGATSTRNGMSLYVFDSDRGTGGSQCYGTCAATWPPLTVASASAITAPAGVNNLGTITRTDGTLQVTLDGRPLYFYTGDSAVGDTRGHSSGGAWWLAAVGGPASNSEYGILNACGLGRPAIANQNIDLGKAYCVSNAPSNQQQVRFKYTPKPSDVGKDVLFTIGHGTGIAGITANQDFGNYASQSDFTANPSLVYGSFGLDPRNQRRTYNRVIVKNVQANKDIWIAVIAGSGGFGGVAIKGEQIVPVSSTLPDACAAGKPEITDQYVNLGEAVCGKASPGPGYYTHFTYRPTASEAGKNFILETNYGTGNANMTANQHYSNAPTSGGTAFAHEEHLADRPDLVFSSFREGVQQRIVYPNAEAGKDILVVIPPGPNGFSKFTFRISVE
ncbi:MAG: PKD domain-containing protein [Rhodanobacteraceae bacterium]|nr:PKD domain-containing protein [Rhodanobacteraceae bacterium]